VTRKKVPRQELCVYRYVSGLRDPLPLHSRTGAVSPLIAGEAMAVSTLDSESAVAILKVSAGLLLAFGIREAALPRLDELHEESDRLGDEFWPVLKLAFPSITIVAFQPLLQPLLRRCGIGKHRIELQDSIYV